ncbi:hypothetical protein Ndes2526B_g07900 [Nannochloris sp. 'desiccata']|nr:hypothetical protein KSW81_002556 [Chlorella desiccata (nom. nud.)]
MRRSCATILLTLASSVTLASCLETLVMGPGVLPVDGLSIDIDEMKRQAVAAANGLSQPYNSITIFQQNMIPASAATNTAAAAPNANPPKQALENLIKLGIVINTIDTYRDDIDQMVSRHDILSNKPQNYLHPAPPTNEYMVEIVNGNFVTGGQDKSGNPICRNLYVSGTNKFELVEAGAGAPFLLDGKMEQSWLVGPEVVRRVMEDAKEQGLDFIRFNAFAVDSQFSAIQSYDHIGNGNYQIVLNEGVMKGIDFVVDQARFYGLKVILVLTDYFADRAGGPIQFMDLTGRGNLTPDEKKSLFYIDDYTYNNNDNNNAREVFRQYIEALATRVNTYNGRVYRDDPAIFAWDIMNEPRCPDGTICATPNIIANFATDFYSYMKNTLSVKQPITVGTDGFFSQGPYSGLYGSTPTAVNPINDASLVAADYNSLCSLVDFCEFNVYPDLWNQENEPWVKAWIQAHSSDAITLGKPTIIKEFGMQPTKRRREFFKIIYDTTYSTIVAAKAAAGGLRGAAYWQIWAQGTEAAKYTLATGGRFGILPTDPEVHIIRQFSWKVYELTKDSTAALDICPAGVQGTALMLQSPQCPKGYAGVGCYDIDECILGLDGCSANAACINTSGSYECECYNGYHGNGKLCIALPISLTRIEKSYYTKNTLSCISTSQDVPYPTTAPGYVVDPTGYFSGNIGNRVAVTLTQCKIACTMADECTSFYFDLIQGSCFLKKNECPYVSSDIQGCTNCGREDCSAPNVSICEKEVYQKNSPAPPITGGYECARGVTYFKKGYDYTANNPLCVPPTTELLDI